MARDIDERVNEIIGLKKKLYNDVYADTRNKFKEDERFYELEFKDDLNLAEDVIDDSIVLPTARDIIDTAVDHTDISNARVDVNRHGMALVDEETAETLRKYFLGMIYRTNVESPISPWRVAAKHYWMHGVCWLKTVWDADRWPDRPMQREDESDEAFWERLKEWQGETELTVPIVIKAVNPYCVMPDPNFMEPQFVIERQEKAYFSIRKNYPDWSNPKQKDITQTVEWVEYWDENEKCYLADDEPVLRTKIAKHKYGFIPYVEIDSGLGNIDTEGKFDRRWVGLLRYLHGILIAESRAFSIEDVVLKKGTYPWYGARDEDGYDGRAKQLKRLDQTYGAVNDLTGIALEKMAPDIPPNALMYHLNMTSSLISSHAAPRSLRGLPEEGVRAASDRRLMIAEAGTMYAHSKDSFKHGTARVLTNCAKLYKNVIPSNIRLWSYIPGAEFDEVIDRDKMKEPFFCNVEFAPISPEDEYRRHDDLRLMVQGLGMPLEWAWSRLPDVDPLKLKEMVEKQKIESNPNFLQAQDAYIAQQLALALQQKENAEMLQSGQMQPQPNSMGASDRMTPQIPNRQMPGSPGQIASARAAQSGQANVPLNPGQGQGGGGANYVR